PCVIQDTDKLFEVHICPPIFKRNIATLRIIGFMKKGKSWQRVKEIHQQRGYTLKDIRECLKKVHLKELASWGNLRKKTVPLRTSGKVWFVVQKKVT
ncbi:hypothetical protein KAX97_07790, partial [candidate division WOR-3 bacterium]|nr:hypothetical protein [candidate division WOR-3 bacterium]